MRVGPGVVSRHAYLFIYFKFLLFGDFLLERQECVLGAAAVWVNGGGGTGGGSRWDGALVQPRDGCWGKAPCPQGCPAAPHGEAPGVLPTLPGTPSKHPASLVSCGWE